MCPFLQKVYTSQDVVQVNIAAESGEMGLLANHVPSIEQLKPGLIEVIEESAGSKQFFRASPSPYHTLPAIASAEVEICVWRSGDIKISGERAMANWDCV